MNTNGLLIGLLMVVVFGVGVYVGRVTEGTPLSFGANSYNKTQSEESGTIQGTVSNEGGTASEIAVTEGQRKLLAAFGLDADSVTITPAMIACGEAKLGAARIEAIKNGATPSFTEGASLVACYK